MYFKWKSMSLIEKSISFSWLWLIINSCWVNHISCMHVCTIFVYIFKNWVPVFFMCVLIICYSSLSCNSRLYNRWMMTLPNWVYRWKIVDPGWRGSVVEPQPRILWSQSDSWRLLIFHSSRIYWIYCTHVCMIFIYSFNSYFY